MKKIMMIATGIIFCSGIAFAQTQNRPINTVNPVVPNATNVTPVNNNVNRNNSNGVIYNSPNNSNTINMNSQDQNSTVPGVNQPGNRVMSQPNQNPIRDNTMSNDPVIYTTPVQAPQTVPAPATPVNPVLGR